MFDRNHKDFMTAERYLQTEPQIILNGERLDMKKPEH